MYRLTVTPVADERLPPELPDAPAPLRLREALKRLWRGQRFKALRVEQQYGAEWGCVLADLDRTFAGGEGI